MFESFLKPSLTFPTLTGSIVTFNSQYALPLKSHTVDIDSVSGVSAINIWGAGKNFLDLGDKTTTGGSYLANKISCFLKAGTYTFSYSFSGANNSGFIAFYDESNNEIYNTSHYTSVGANTKIIVLPSTAYKFTFYSNAAGSYTDFQIEIGSMATSFEVYNGTQTTINIGQTVYGGEYDARSGVLTVTHGFVTYDSNNVPSMQTGTVVYPLATPTTIQLPPCPIDTLQGVNNIWADTGDTTLQYPKFG